MKTSGKGEVLTELTDKKIVGKIVPKIVKKFFSETLSRKELKNLSLLLSENVLRYGYNDRRVITEVYIPEFSDRAEEFFRILNESVYMVKELDSRQYNRIIDFAVSSKARSPEQKVFDYLEMRIESLKMHRKEIEELHRNRPFSFTMHNDFYSLRKDNDLY